MNPAPRIAVVVAPFYRVITDGLMNGVREVLGENHVELRSEDLYTAPGAFELPLLAKKLARTRRYDGVICLGCVIKGETAHFEFISLAAGMGIQQASLETEVPIAFGILTTYTEDQAVRRSSPGPENKGREAAHACLESIRTLRRIENV